MTKDKLRKGDFGLLPDGESYAKRVLNGSGVIGLTDGPDHLEHIGAVFVRFGLTDAVGEHEVIKGVGTEHGDIA